MLQSSSPFLVTFSEPIERIIYQYDKGEKEPVIPITINRRKLKSAMFDLNHYFIVKTTKVLVNKLMINECEGEKTLILQEVFASIAESSPVFQELSSTFSRNFKIVSVEKEGFILNIKAVHEIYNRLDDGGTTEIIIRIYLNRNTFLHRFVFNAVSNEYKKMKKFIGC